MQKRIKLKLKFWMLPLCSLAIFSESALAVLSQSGNAPQFEIKDNSYACGVQPCNQFNGQVEVKGHIVFNPSADPKDNSRSVFFQNGQYHQTRPEKGEYVELKADFSTHKLRVSEVFLPDSSAQKTFNKLNPQIITYGVDGKVNEKGTLGEAQKHFGGYLAIQQKYIVNECNGPECRVQDLETGKSYPATSH